MGDLSPWQLGFGQLPEIVIESIKSRLDGGSWRRCSVACRSYRAAFNSCRRQVMVFADRESGVVTPSVGRLATCFPALEELTLDDNNGVVVAALACLPGGALPTVRHVKGPYYRGLADEELQQLVRLCPNVETVVRHAVTTTMAVLPLLTPWGASLQKLSCKALLFSQSEREPQQIAAATAALASLTRLQDLQMDCGEGRGAAVLAAALPALTSLTRLSLEDWSFAGLAQVLRSCATGCRGLQALQLGRMWSEARDRKASLDWKDHDWAGYHGLELPGVTSLTLWTEDWCNGVPDNEKVTLSATWFARGAVGLHSCFPSLESLTVDAEGIYRCGLDIYPGALPTFQNLRELTVNRFCFHSSPQPEAFVSLAPNLASLVVSELPMSDLTPLANHPTLEKLTLSGYQTDTLDVEGVPTYDAILRSLPRLGRVTLEGRGWNLWPGEADDPYDCASALLRSLAAWRAGRLTQFVYEVAEPDSAALPLGYVLPRLAAELGPSLNWLELYPCRLPRARGGGGLPESVREGGLLCLPLFERLRYMELHVEAEMDEGPVRLPIAKERIDALVQPLVYGGCVAPCLRELVVKLPAVAVTSGVWAHCESMSAECPGGVLRFELV